MTTRSKKNRKAMRGIIRDRASGVVLARDHQHPGAFIFESVPIHSPDHPDATIPPMNYGPEFCQVMAIHCFDNLGMSMPTRESSNYRLVRSAQAEHVPTQFRHQLWLPWAVSDEFIEPVVVDPVTDEDLASTPIDEMTDGQLIALQAKVDSETQARQRRAALDVPIEDDEPDWVRHRREALNAIDDKIAATKPTQTE